MPKEAKFKFEFQQGKPWLHENLYAPYDFAIIKSEEELNKEIQAIQNNSSLYFVLDESVAEKALYNLNNDLLAQLDTLKVREHKKYIEIIPIATQ